MLCNAMFYLHRCENFDYTTLLSVFHVSKILNLLLTRKVKWINDWVNLDTPSLCYCADRFLVSSKWFHTRWNIWLHKPISQSPSLSCSLSLSHQHAGLSQKWKGWKPVAIRMMCLTWEPKGKVCKVEWGEYEYKNSFLFFLNLCYKMAITGLFSLFSVMNSFAYAEIVAVACWGRPANACINAFGGTWSRSTLWSR